MKRGIVLFIVLLQISGSLIAQQDYNGYRGFYLSMALGGSYLSINDAITNGPYKTMEMKGSAIPFDLKLGYAFSENFIIHGDLIGISSLSIDVTADGQDIGTISGDNSVSMLIFGVGSTYYFLPSNIFVSGTLGVSNFSITQGNTTTNTKTGFGLHAKLGKEWRISRKWKIGASFGVSYAKVNNEADNMEEKISGTSLGLSFNASRY